jgi:hypothetical protein
MARRQLVASRGQPPRANARPAISSRADPRSTIAAAWVASSTGGGVGIRAGDVQDANRLARDRVAHERRGTRGVVKSFAVVLGGENLHRLPVREGGADSVCADVKLGPTCAQHDTGLFVVGVELRVSALRENQAVRISQREAFDDPSVRSTRSINDL